MNTHELIEQGILALQKAKETLPAIETDIYHFIEVDIAGRAGAVVRIPAEHAAYLKSIGATLIGKGWYGAQLQADYGLAIDGFTLYTIIHPEHCEQLGLEPPAVAGA